MIELVAKKEEKVPGGTETWVFSTHSLGTKTDLRKKERDAV